MGERMTLEGLERLREDLRNIEAALADVQKGKAEAAELGGNAWHDNFAFEELERQERVLMRRLSEARQRINKAEIVDVVGIAPSRRVAFGSTVTVTFLSEDGADEEEATFTIFGSADAAPEKGIISELSPLGAALLGTAEGVVVTYDVQMGPGKISQRVRVVAIGGNVSVA